VQPLRRKWFDSTYSCAYVFSFGSMVLSVKELPSNTAADAYNGKVEAQLAGTDNVVLAQDNKVRVVDVRGLPTRVGLLTRGEVAHTVADTILQCWPKEQS